MFLRQLTRALCEPRRRRKYYTSGAVLVTHEQKLPNHCYTHRPGSRVAFCLDK